MFTNITTYVDGHDFTCDTNKAMLDVTVAELDASTFCSNGWQDLIAGLKSHQFSMEGLWQAGTAQVDPEVFPTLGVAKTVTFASSGTETSPAYIWQSIDVHYELPRGSYGELAQFMINSVGQNGQGVIRGQLTIAK